MNFEHPNFNRRTSTLNVGYTAGTAIMDLSLLGTVGMVTQDDFVLEWTNSIAFQNDDFPIGYDHRSGRATRKEFAFVEAPSSGAQDVLMINDFANLVARNDAAGRKACAETSLRTQSYLDAIWNIDRN